MPDGARKRCMLHFMSVPIIFGWAPMITYTPTHPQKSIFHLYLFDSSIMLPLDLWCFAFINKDTDEVLPLMGKASMKSTYY